VVMDEGGAAAALPSRKPSWGEVISDLATPASTSSIPRSSNSSAPGRSTDWSGDVFPETAERGRARLRVDRDGYWEDVGSHAAYVKANSTAWRAGVKGAGARRSGGRVDLDPPPTRKCSKERAFDGPASSGPGPRLRAGAWINGPAGDRRVHHGRLGREDLDIDVWDHSYIRLDSRLRGSVVLPLRHGQERMPARRGKRDRTATSRSAPARASTPTSGSGRTKR